MIDFFISTYQNATLTQIILELLVFVFGILSVYLAKKENIGVYPTGLVATIITTYILYQAGYFADMVINAYYSVMSIYGWFKWSSVSNDASLNISKTSSKEKWIGVGLFLATMLVTFTVYKFFDYKLEIPNYIDIFTSGLFFTAMWYMALKKIENWILWIIGDCIVVPLFAYRGLGMLSLQYLVFTIIAFYGYFEWKKIIQQKIN